MFSPRSFRFFQSGLVSSHNNKPLWQELICAIINLSGQELMTMDASALGCSSLRKFIMFFLSTGMIIVLLKPMRSSDCRSKRLKTSSNTPASWSPSHAVWVEHYPWIYPLQGCSYVSLRDQDHKVVRGCGELCRYFVVLRQTIINIFFLLGCFQKCTEN